ncbi:homoserine kinase [Pelagibacteraceae bacterium]|jgi:homoserine kinase type II|nr:homoserine kinase [Pelagibacteraceae bacterium]
MAIYTKVDTHEAKFILKNYNLGELKKIQGIKKGIENTNYLLITTTGKFILTLFEKRVQAKELPFFMNLMLSLNDRKILCPKPIKNKNKKTLFQIKNRQAAICSFVYGKEKNSHTLSECRSIGKNIAKLHMVGKKIKLHRANNLSIKSWIALNQSIKTKANKKIPNIYSFINTLLLDLKKKWPSQLPTGIIHGDLFPDNIFFNKKKFAGFIDFYFSCSDFLIYDIAICINAMCFDKKIKFNKLKANALLKGYSSLRKISKKEFTALPQLLLGASIRFFLTRLHDSINRQKGAVVKVKNPNEFLKRIQFYINTKNVNKLFY